MRLTTARPRIEQKNFNAEVAEVAEVAERKQQRKGAFEVNTTGWHWVDVLVVSATSATSAF